MASLSDEERRRRGLVKTRSGVYAPSFMGNATFPVRNLPRTILDEGLLPALGGGLADTGRTISSATSRFFLGPPETVVDPAMSPSLVMARGGRPGTRFGPPPTSILPAGAAPTATRFIDPNLVSGRATFLGSQTFQSPESRAIANRMGDINTNNMAARAGGYSTNEDRRAFVEGNTRQAANVVRQDRDRSANLEASKYEAQAAAIARMRDGGAAQDDIQRAIIGASMEESIDPTTGDKTSRFNPEIYKQIEGLVSGNGTAAGAPAADLNGDGKISADEEQYNKVATILAEHKNANSEFELTPAQETALKARKAKLAYTLGLPS